MAILGSRDRMCIHKNIRPRSEVDNDNGRRKKVNASNINLLCRIRTQNTERVSLDDERFVFLYIIFMFRIIGFYFISL